MKLSELIKELQLIQNHIGSHPRFDDSVSFFLYGEEEDIELKVKSVEVDSMPSCGCWVGADIHLITKGDA